MTLRVGDPLAIMPFPDIIGAPCAMCPAPRPPDIFHIGYPKTASTWLFDYFNAYDDVYVDRKAKNWANRPEGPDRTPEEEEALSRARLYVSCGEKTAEARLMHEGTDWKALRFDPAVSVRIDEVLSFAPGHFAEQLRQRAPEAKVVVCIRDQVDWLSSAYRWYIDDLPAGRRKFSDFCNTPEGQLLLRAGCYDETIEAYLRVFGPERLCVLRFEQLRSDKAAFLARLQAFTGLAPVAFDAPAANKGRSGATTLVHQKAPWLAKIPAPLRRLGKPVLEAVTGRLGAQDALTVAEREMLHGFYVFSNQRTRALLAEIDAAQVGDRSARQAAAGS